MHLARDGEGEAARTTPRTGDLQCSRDKNDAAVNVCEESPRASLL